MGTSSASTLDVVAENCLNTLAKIEYDKNLQACLAAVRSGETESAKAKILLRDIIDDNIALNYVFLGLVVTGDGGETKYQSSALTVPEEIVAEAKDQTRLVHHFLFRPSPIRRLPFSRSAVLSRKRFLFLGISAAELFGLYAQQRNIFQQRPALGKSARI